MKVNVTPLASNRGNTNVLYGDVILFTFACWLAKGKAVNFGEWTERVCILRSDSLYVVV
jgi:hypothetical protein